MRIIAIMTAGAVLLAVSCPAQAGPFSPVGPSAYNVTSIELVATEKKSETVTQKVKRVWKNLVGYKFDVACPLGERPVKIAAISAVPPAEVFFRQPFRWR
jgi:hypothetical protein